jgi:hypothetical protein
VPAQPLKLFDQTLCSLLDISKESIMIICGERPFFGFVIVPRILDGIAQPFSRFLVRQGYTGQSKEFSNPVVSQSSFPRESADP